MMGTDDVARCALKMAYTALITSKGEAALFETWAVTSDLNIEYYYSLTVCKLPIMNELNLFYFLGLSIGHSILLCMFRWVAYSY